MPLEPIGHLRDLGEIAEGSSLYVLAVGVGSFRTAPLMPLRFAAKDACDVADALDGSGRRSFSRVIIDVLTGEQATRDNLLRAVEALSRRVQTADTAILFLAGHGLSDEHSDLYYYAPYDLDERSPLATAVPGAMLCQHLLPLPGRRLLIADTCNAESISEWRVGARGPQPRSASTTVVRQFGRAHAESRSADTDHAESLVVIASSRANQEAKESARWENGVFTKALLEGIRGRADNGMGAVTIRMLSSYVRSRVRELTKDGQQPVCTVLAGAQDFELLRTAPAAQDGDTDPLLGTTVGAFHVVARTAQTARSTIYRAIDEGDSDAFIQLRVLDSDLSAQPATVQRFRDAAEALHRVSHPGLARILEPGGMASDGRAFIIFQSAPGPLLGELIHGATDLERSRRVCLELLDTLNALHEQGVLYLGLSPNRVVLREPTQQALLLDSEWACLHQSPLPILQKPDDSPVADLTDPEHYLAPELSDDLDPARLDERADVFALGVLAYVLYAGVAPFPGDTCGAIRAAKRQPTRRLAELATQLPAAASAIIDRMLSLDPAQRPGLEEVRSAWSQGPDRPPNVSPGSADARPQPWGGNPSPTPVNHSVSPAVQSEQGTVWTPPAAQRLPQWPQLISTPNAATLVASGGSVFPIEPQRPAPLSGLPTMVIGRPAVPPAPPSPRSLAPLWIAAAAIGCGLSAWLAYDRLRTPPAPVRSERPPLVHRPDVCLSGGTLKSSAGPIPVHGFCMDRLEVSNGRFFTWLRGQRIRISQQLVLGPDQQPWLSLSSSSGLRYANGQLQLVPTVAEQPIVEVSAHAASAFCEAQGGSLPSETQWLYAALGPVQERAYPWGSDSPRCQSVRLQSVCPAGTRLGPVNVGTSVQDTTPDGIHDLLGSVSEWVLTRRPSGHPAYHARIGGAYSRPLHGWQSVVRVTPGEMSPATGFRCVRPANEVRIRVAASEPAGGRS